MFKLDWRKRLIAATPLISLLIYLSIGNFAGIWDKSLLIFLLIPAMPTILGMRTIKITFTLIIVIIYIVIGVAFDLWHPGWLIFMLIPIYYILFGRVGIQIERHQKHHQNENSIDVEFEDK